MVTKMLAAGQAAAPAVGFAAPVPRGWLRAYWDSAGVVGIRRSGYRHILDHVATTTRKAWTDEELMALPDEGKYELVDGELHHVSPAGARHGRLVVRLAAKLVSFVTRGQTRRGLRRTDWIPSA